MERLLIVDDEMEVVEYFESILKEDIDLELEIYKAYSAKEAIQSLEEYVIDVIFCDIQMPKINGLKLYETIKEKWPKCKVIFLSGVLQFDYVYASIQQRDVRYLTKLEPPQKIIETLKEVIQEIRESYKQEHMMEHIKQQLEEALPMLQNKYLKKIIMGIEEDVDEINQRIKDLKLLIDITKPFNIVAGIFDENSKNISESKKEHYSLTIKNVVCSQLGTYYEVACYISEEDTFTWLLQEKEDVKLNRVVLNNQLEYVQKSIKHILDRSFTFAYYDTKIDYTQIDKVYSFIKGELGYKSSTLKGSIIMCSQHKDTTKVIPDTTYVIDSQKQLIHINELEGYLELGKEASYFALFHKIVGCLKAVRSFHYGPAIEIYYRVMGVLLKYINRWSLEERLAFKIPLYKLTHLEMHDTWEEAVVYLEHLSKNIFDIRFADGQKWSINALTYIYHYIDEHLGEDLSLTTLADQVNLNPSYLSRLFKSVTNENLYDYILCVRMNKAKELLVKTPHRIQDIGVEVGYESAQSFTRVFRKYTGTTPSEYREKE